MGRTHQGMVRKLNEDAFIESPDTALWAVADGMGGHKNGDFASAMIVQRLGRIAGAGTAYALRREVARQLALANEELLTRAQDSSRGPMGATVAVLTACGGYYSCTWAGDSRIYLLRKGRLRRITSDHSVVQSLIDAGELSPEEARHHSKAHVVTRAVGAKAELLLDTANGELMPGDRFLLCSDGLTSVSDDATILDLIADKDPETAIDGLINHTLSQGAPDNVTAILTDVLNEGD
ncbi:PP2C family protein-serine/threonine phosphatase [Henriciella aquimarina]|uniref:PP2C family protein-serine/threonine phosphatase n=1 Tax=Henriciella aquimarina TaxID=545261 RepID=UPI001F26FB63|nr:protein phosphatase 2C domain-containing protein [Henriciella aquimarina]